MIRILGIDPSTEGFYWTALEYPYTAFPAKTAFYHNHALPNPPCLPKNVSQEFDVSEFKYVASGFVRSASLAGLVEAYQELCETYAPHVRCIERAGNYSNRGAFANILALTKIVGALQGCDVTLWSITASGAGNSLRGGWRPFLHQIARPKLLKTTWDALAKAYVLTHVRGWPVKLSPAEKKSGKVLPSSDERDAACVAIATLISASQHTFEEAGMKLTSIY